MRVKNLLFLLPALSLMAGCGDTPPAPQNELIKIEINTAPTKTEYTVGEKLDPAGLVINCVGTLETKAVAYESIKEEVIFAPSLEKELALTDTLVEITYKEKKTSFTIEVKENTPKTLSCKMDFSSIDMGSKRQIFGTEDAFADLVSNAINSQADEDLLTSLEVSTENSVKLEKSEFPNGIKDVQGLIVGTSKYDGEITFNFSKKITKATFTIQQYYNIYLNKGVLTTRYDGQRPVETEDDYYFEGYYEIEVNNQKIEGTGASYTYDEYWNVIELDPPVIPDIETKQVEINSKNLTIYGFGGVRTRIYQLALEFEEE